MILYIPPYISLSPFCRFFPSYLLSLSLTLSHVLALYLLQRAKHSFALPSLCSPSLNHAWLLSPPLLVIYKKLSNPSYLISAEPVCYTSLSLILCLICFSPKRIKEAWNKDRLCTSNFKRWLVSVDQLLDFHVRSLALQIPSLESHTYPDNNNLFALLWKLHHRIALQSCKKVHGFSLVSPHASMP